MLAASSWWEAATLWDLIAGEQGVEFVAVVDAELPEDVVEVGFGRAYRYHELLGDLVDGQSSTRICVEHAIADSKNWRPLQRWTGRRDDLPETIQAIGSLVSDRAAAR